jgi:hypothetical protein
VLNVLKYGSLNLPEPYGPIQAYNGIALPFKVVPVYILKAYRGSRNIAPLILDPAMDGCEWSASRFGRLMLRKKNPN